MQAVSETSVVATWPSSQACSPSFFVCLGWSFELPRLAGKPTSGILKDVAMLGGCREAEIDFIANNPGLTLFHCHQQLHLDFGFRTLFDYV